MWEAVTSRPDAPEDKHTSRGRGKEEKGGEGVDVRDGGGGRAARRRRSGDDRPPPPQPADR